MNYHLAYEKHPFESDKVISIVKGKGKHYNKFIVIREGEGRKKIEVNNNELIEPVLSECMSRIYVAGESGAGKSTIMSQLIKNSSEPAYIVSAKHHDPAFEGLEDVHNVDVKKLVEHPIKHLSEWKHSTFVFDDIQFPNKEMDKKVKRQADYLLNLGRSKHVNVIYSSWAFTAGNKYPLLQAQAIIFFPGLDTLAIRKYLQLRGKDKKSIDHILNQKNTRWVILLKFPLCVITQKKVELI